MTKSSLDWPFDDSRDVATVTSREVMDGSKAILLVTHDEDDGMWTFLTGEPFSMDTAMLVGLGEVAKRDPTVLQLADLPVGWYAQRATSTSAWERFVLPPTEDEAAP